MANPEILKSNIRRKLSVEEIRQIWTKRENDKMFYEVGEYFFKPDIYSHLERDEFHIVAWKGFEYLVDLV